MAYDIMKIKIVNLQPQFLMIFNEMTRFVNFVQKLSNFNKL